METLCAPIERRASTIFLLHLQSSWLKRLNLSWSMIRKCGLRFSLATKAETRLRGDHAQLKESERETIRRNVIVLSWRRVSNAARPKPLLAVGQSQCPKLNLGLSQFAAGLLATNQAPKRLTGITGQGFVRRRRWLRDRSRSRLQNMGARHDRTAPSRFVLNPSTYLSWRCRHQRRAARGDDAYEHLIERTPLLAAPFTSYNRTRRWRS